MAYIDTSLLVAYYCPEPLSPKADSLLRGLREPVISPLVEVEFYSAVAAKLRVGDTDRPSAEQIVAMFRQHVDDGRYRLVPIAPRLFAMARDWIGRFDAPLRAADALHLAAASANGLKLLTADQGLAKSAKLLRVQHRLISG